MYYCKCIKWSTQKLQWILVFPAVHFNSLSTSFFLYFFSLLSLFSLPSPTFFASLFIFFQCKSFTYSLRSPKKMGRRGEPFLPFLTSVWSLLSTPLPFYCLTSILFILPLFSSSVPYIFLTFTVFKSHSHSFLFIWDLISINFSQIHM